jgi:hypothetical protein
MPAKMPTQFVPLANNKVQKHVFAYRGCGTEQFVHERGILVNRGADNATARDSGLFINAFLE